MEGESGTNILSCLLLMQLVCSPAGSTQPRLVSFALSLVSLDSMWSNRRLCRDTHWHMAHGTRCQYHHARTHMHTTHHTTLTHAHTTDRFFCSKDQGRSFVVTVCPCISTKASSTRLMEQWLLNWYTCSTWKGVGSRRGVAGVWQGAGVTSVCRW